MTSRLSNLRTLRHACTIYSSDNQHGVSRNSHAFNCLCGDQFNKCVCGLDAIVTRDKILRTHENGVSRMSAPAQARREDTTGEYRKVRIYAASFANRSLRAVTSTPCFLAMW